MEAGVCQGGATIFLRALQVAYEEAARRTWVADSFQGVPPPSHDVDVHHKLDLSESRQPWIAFTRQMVEDNFRTYDLLDGHVHFIEGWFKDTLHAAPVEQLAILRLDGDLYESTWDTLAACYDRVVAGGFVIVDDYGALTPCRMAVDDFRRSRAITDRLRTIDWTGVFWRKSA
jgi:O-methyltransferase